MSKTSSKAQCKSNCPLRSALKILEGKYSIDILRELLHGTKRFGELKNEIPGISPKTLTEKLRFFMKHGIINRRSYPEIPPKVEYELTERGDELKSVIANLETLGEKFNDAPLMVLPDNEDIKEKVRENNS